MLTVPDMYAEPQLAARDYFQPLENTETRNRRAPGQGDEIHGREPPARAPPVRPADARRRQRRGPVAPPRRRRRRAAAAARRSGDRRPDAVPMSDLTHADAVAVFERRRDAWLSGDLDAYLALFAADLVIDIPRRERIVGRDTYAELVRLSHEHVAPLRLSSTTWRCTGPSCFRSGRSRSSAETAGNGSRLVRRHEPLRAPRRADRVVRRGFSTPAALRA